MSIETSTILENAIKALLDENKQPTVALVKTKLSQPVALPLVIQAVQNWKQLKQMPQQEVALKIPNVEERIALLEAQVNALTARILQLESITENPKKG